MLDFGTNFENRDIVPGFHNVDFCNMLPHFFISLFNHFCFSIKFFELFLQFELNKKWRRREFKKAAEISHPGVTN